jgi:hypothetical protein
MRLAADHGGECGAATLSTRGPVDWFQPAASKRGPQAAASIPAGRAHPCRRDPPRDGLPYLVVTFAPSGIVFRLPSLAFLVSERKAPRPNSRAKVIDRRALNLSNCFGLWPCKPAAFSCTYSTILARASGGSCDDINMRLMIAAESPEALWLALRMVQAVLRQSPSAVACSSSVTKPAVTRASPISLILDDCRVFPFEIVMVE